MKLQSKTFMKMILAISLSGLLISCASTEEANTNKDTDTSTAQKVPYTTEREAEVIPETAAEKINAHSFVEITFEKNSATLTKSSKDSIRSLIKLNKMDQNKLDQVIVLAWADQEYPSEQKEELSPKQVNLAKKRTDAISKFVKSIQDVTVETHSMAQQPSKVSEWLNTQDSKIKNSLVAAGLPTSADKMKFPSKASHALIFALRN